MPRRFRHQTSLAGNRDCAGMAARLGPPICRADEVRSGAVREPRLPPTSELRRHPSTTCQLVDGATEDPPACAPGSARWGHRMRDVIVPLLLFAAAMTFTPGPNVVLVTASGANFGFRRTIPQMIGI